MKKPERAFILRQSPSGNNQMEAISLPQNVIVNGWSEAEGLIQEKDWWAFREILRKAYYSGESNLRKAGYAASTMWRFISGMQIGDWVVVPHWGGQMYVAEIVGDAYYDSKKAAVDTDSCYRRAVRWLNGAKPIPRAIAKAKLVSRMKTQQTSAEASDLIEDIYEVLVQAGKEQTGTEIFASSVRQKMVAAMLNEIHNGVMSPRQMEKLVGKLLQALGATNIHIIGTSKDKGVDITASFLDGQVTQLTIGVQVKHHEGETANEYIDQLVRGLEAEDLDYGWFVTAGSFSPKAEEYLQEKLQGTGFRVSLVDGQQFANLIIDAGLENIF